jgi:hypothetical protein
MGNTTGSRLRDGGQPFHAVESDPTMNGLLELLALLLFWWLNLIQLGFQLAHRPIGSDKFINKSGAFIFHQFNELVFDFVGDF